MSRRRMMMGRQVVNLFNKDSEDILYKYRLSVSGKLINSDSASTIMFVSDFIDVKPNANYVLIRMPYSTSANTYDKWCLYDSSKIFIKYKSSSDNIINIQIPENCYYIRFNGLIEDIDNVKFYKV